jgi:hypothetical protein
VQTIEGNINPEGSEEDIMVVEKERKLDQQFSQNVLNFIGFVYPNEGG